MQTYIAKAAQRNRLGFAQGRIAMAKGYARLVVVSGSHQDSGWHGEPTDRLCSVEPGTVRPSWPSLPASVLGS